MKRFSKISTTNAMKAAFADMKAAKINYGIIKHQNAILKQHVEIVPLNI